MCGCSLPDAQSRIKPWKPFDLRTFSTIQGLGLRWSGMALRGRDPGIISRISPVADRRSLPRATCGSPAPVAMSKPP